MNVLKNRALTLLAAMAIGAAGCQGEKGPAGAAGAAGQTGATGATGQQGVTGYLQGSVAGAVTFQPGATVAPLPATGLVVTTVPDAGVSTTTAADGTYALNLPIGTYSLVFSGQGFTTFTSPGVTVNAQKTTAYSATVKASTPFTVTAAKLPNPTGFNQPVTLGVKLMKNGQAVTDLTGYSFAWTSVSGPTPVTLQGATTAAPGFTTGTFAAIAATTTATNSGGVVGPINGLSVPARPGFIGISNAQRGQMTYNVKCLVTDPQGFQAAVTVAVVPVQVSQASMNFAPLGVNLIGNDKGTTFSWSLKYQLNAADTNVVDRTSLLDSTTIQNPTFTPDTQGLWTLTNAVTGSSISATASKYIGALSAATCQNCHDPSLTDSGYVKYPEILAVWKNSVHGNHWFKESSYDASGNLVVKDPSTGGPYTDPTTGWVVPGPMTLFEVGLSGGEGSHYGASCLGCHTVGYDPTAANAGFDDLAALDGWSFPPLPASQTNFDLTRYAALPADLQGMRGMQCESCHGPMEQHTGVVKPAQMFSVNSCAGCHDAPSHHDQVELWDVRRVTTNWPNGQGHSNLDLAMSEGSSAGCAKCHTSQGFIAWADSNFSLVSCSTTVTTNCYDAAHAPAPGAKAEPQTCQTCHDPHSTTLRLDTTQPIALEAGYTISGEGLGQLCQVCHQSRRGLVDDQHPMTAVRASHEPSQADILNGRNVFLWGNGTVGTPGRHAIAVQDSCVGCHMKYEAAFVTKQLGHSFAKTNHSFHVDGNVCTNCHGTSVTIESLQGQVETLMSNVVAAVNGKYAGSGSSLPSSYAVTQYFRATDTYSAAPVVLSGAPSSIDFSEIHGAPGFVFHFGTSAVEFQVGSMVTVDSSGNPTTTKYVSPTSNLAKGLWNYWQVDHDRSYGAHNPSFVLTFLNATVQNIGN